MRLLVVSPAFPYPLIKGIKIRLFNIVSQLARKHEVHLAAMALKEDPAHCPELEAVVAGLTRLPSPRIVWDPNHRPGIADDIRHAAAKLLRSEPNLVSIHVTPALKDAMRPLACIPFDAAFCFRTYLFPQVAAIAGDRPVLVDFDDVEHVKIRAQSAYLPGRLSPFLDRLESGKLRNWEYWIARQAAASFVCSKRDRSHFPPALRSRIHVLPNGARFDTPEPARAPAAAEGPPRLLLLGDMGYLPNADSALTFCERILPQIRARVPEVEVAIVGNHPGPEVRALGRLPGVQVTGFVPDIVPWFQSAAVVVVPIRFGGGTRIKILEALRHRRAVVATPAGVAGLDPESGKHLVVAEIGTEFADQVVALLRDPARRRALGEAGEEWARRTFSWDRIGDHLLAVVEETAGRVGNSAAVSGRAASSR